MKTKKYLPYVRRANGREKSESFRGALRLAFYKNRGGKFYVLVQHGFPNFVVECGRTKREVQNTPIAVAFGHKSFAQWARAFQRSNFKNA